MFIIFQRFKNDFTIFHENFLKYEANPF